ncbi:TPA: hypothetical protein ACH3X1_015562 [Trebouxia sp. C0004]
MHSASVTNLEYVARSSAQKGHILFVQSICSVHNRSFQMAKFYLEAAANGGKGHTYCHVLKEEGFCDPADPWGEASPLPRQ